jgi:hypothetical protein
MECADPKILTLRGLVVYHIERVHNANQGLHKYINESSYPYQDNFMGLPKALS